MSILAYLLDSCHVDDDKLDDKPLIIIKSKLKPYQIMTYSTVIAFNGKGLFLIGHDPASFFVSKSNQGLSFSTSYDFKKSVSLNLS